MTIKEAIEIINDNRGTFIVKKFIRNHKKCTEQDLKGEKSFKYFCAAHKKCHKYTFHSIIETVPGSANLYGFDTAKQVKEFAKETLLKVKKFKK